jgi:hypothetical protein
MRKLMLSAAGLVALLVTSVAVAHGIEGARTAKAVAGTFTAATSNVSTRTCTTSDGKAIVVTNGKYTGVAAGDPDLTGPITLRAHSVVNTTDGVGVVDGWFKIDVAAGRDTTTSYSAVYDHGTIAGLAAGRAHDPSARLVANLSATFASGSAVELGSGSCKPSHTKPEKSQARGTISALSSSSITVAGLTCAVPADRSAQVTAKFKTGDRAEIHCALAGSQNTLTRIEKR